MYYARLNGKHINIAAFYSDLTNNFVNPIEPKRGDKVTIKIRADKSHDYEVFLVTSDNEFKMDCNKNLSEKFDYYEYKFDSVQDSIVYYFKIIYGNDVYYYNTQGISKNINDELKFRIIPDFITPDWAKSAVFYQIFVDRFNNGDKTNDVVNNEYMYLGTPAKSLDWNKAVENRDVANFYGGDLQGILDKLDYLQDLGVEVLYLNPIFVSPSSHKYDIQDYDYIDPHFAKIVEDGGEVLRFERFRNEYATKYMQRTTSKANLEASNDFFAHFMQVVHEKGMKVVIDGVFNHCGAFNKWLDKDGLYEKNGYPVGAYKSKDSEYHSFFDFKNEDAFPNNNTYSSWWGHDNHPKLNFEASQMLENYILDIAKKWVSPPYNVDGWRLDVAADLGHSEEYNHKFWKKFRRAVKDANPNAIIISEHYGSAEKWLQGDEWDTIMNYDAFMEPVTWFLTGLEKHSEKRIEFLENNAVSFMESMAYNNSKLNISALNSSMNQLSNHDHSRFLTRTNRTVGRLHTEGRELADVNTNVAIMFSAIVLQMTWYGSPTLYYGDEVGLTGWTDPDNRRPFPWGNENLDIYNFYKAAIWIHRENSAIKNGSLEMLASEYGLLVYSRWNKENTIFTVINNNDFEKSIVVPAWRCVKDNDATLQILLQSEGNKFKVCDETIVCVNGFFELDVKPKSTFIIKEI